jgi:hypothetical protein
MLRDLVGSEPTGYTVPVLFVSNWFLTKGDGVGRLRPMMSWVILIAGVIFVLVLLGMDFWPRQQDRW